MVAKNMRDGSIALNSCSDDMFVIYSRALRFMHIGVDRDLQLPVFLACKSFIVVHLLLISLLCRLILQKSCQRG